MSARVLRGLLVVVAALAFAPPAHAALSVLDNGKIRVGVDLDQGGKLTWLSRSQGEQANNLLFEAEQSYYGGPFSPDWSPFWHGYQDPASVVAHSNDGRTIYERSVWIGCECSMETWITLHGNAVVVRNRLRSFRSDATSYPAGWQELPALYAAGPYRIITYDGPDPYMHRPTHDATALARFPFFTPTHYDMLASEHWAALVDDSGFGIGLVEPDLLRIVGVSGYEHGVPSGYLTGVRQELLDANVVYDYKYTLVVGSLRQIRAYAYAHRPRDPRPSYLFAHDRQHFIEVNATDAGFPIAGALRVRLGADDPQIVGPEQEWPARRVPHLYIRGAWHTREDLAEVFWGRPVPASSFSGDRERVFHVIPDGRFKTYRVDLFRSPGYWGTIMGFRLDPVPSAEPGSWVDITCISWKPCPVDRKAERRLASDGGRIPFLDTFETLNTAFWSVGGNSTGASAAVADGALVIDVAPDATPLPGQDYVTAGVTSRCTLAGDFDAQVSYSLELWPPDNGVNLNFTVDNRTLFRHNGSAGEALASYFPPYPGRQIGATAPTGSLRLVRTGTLVRGYYRRDDGDWLELDAAQVARGPLNVALSIFTNRSPAQAEEVQVAFDDFRMTRGEIDCPS